MPFIHDDSDYDEHDPPLRDGEESPDNAFVGSALSEEILTNISEPSINDDVDVDTDSEIALEDLQQSKTCDSGCCDHSCGCNCRGCFCRVVSDLKIEYNALQAQASAGTHGSRAFTTPANEKDAVANALSVLVANRVPLATISLATGSTSLPIDIAHRSYRADSLVAPPSLSALQQRDGHQSPEEHRRVNIARFGLPDRANRGSDGNADANMVEVTLPSLYSDSESHPGEGFTSPESDIFTFEDALDERQRHDALPTSLYHSATLGGAGGQFEPTTALASSLTATVATTIINVTPSRITDQPRNNSLLEMISSMSLNFNLDAAKATARQSLCIYPLVLVPDCRHIKTVATPVATATALGSGGGFANNCTCLAVAQEEDLMNDE